MNIDHRSSEFRGFLVVAKIQGRDVSLFSNEFVKFNSSVQINLSVFVQLND